ncbi:MAG: hypothetical protein AABW64_04800 [Nanoarchaeota archaeon]
MGKESSNRHFFIAIVLVLGAIVFAASLQPESTGQLVTKNSFGPTQNLNPQLSNMIAENCNSCPEQYTTTNILYPGRTEYCSLKQDCPSKAVLACSTYKCTYECYVILKGGINIQTPKQSKDCIKSQPIFN